MANSLVRVLKYSFCALLLAGMASAADPEWLGLIPSDTGVVVGINLEPIRSSKFGQMLFAQIEAQAKGAEEMAKPGLDLLHGTREILVAAPAAAQKGRMLILVTGTFNAAPLQALAKLGGMTEASVQGVTVFTKEQKEPFSAAVVDSSLILAGDPASVKAAIARRGGQPGGGLDPAVAAKLRAVRASHHIWLLTTTPLADLARNAPPEAFGGALQGDAIKSIQQISGGITFGPKLLIAFEVVTRTEQDATSMADGLRALIGMATMGDNAKQFAPLLQSLDLKADGVTMKLALAIAEEDIMKLIPQGVKDQPAPAPKPQQP